MNVEIETGDVQCHRCQQPALLSAGIPHRMQLPGGTWAAGRRTVVLCPRCDWNDPAAQGVLAFFTLYEQIDQGTVESAGKLLRQWIAHIVNAAPAYTDDDLNEDIRKWESGDM